MKARLCSYWSKFVFLAAMMVLFAGCVPAQPPSSTDGGSSTTAPAEGSSSSSNTTQPSGGAYGDEGGYSNTTQP